MSDSDETVADFDGVLVSAGGWCAPSDQIYDLQIASPTVDGQITARRGGLDFLTPPPPRPPKPAPEPLPPAPEGAPAGHWEFGVELDSDSDAAVAWSDWDFYGQAENYRTPEDARDGHHYEQGARIVRRWQPDPFPYEPHVPTIEEHEDA